MFFMPRDNWNTWFFLKVLSLLCGFLNDHVAAFFDASALKEIHILYVISIINANLRK